MCGRYYLDTLPETLMEYFSLPSVPSLSASYNIAPTDVCPIVLADQGARRLEHARWGLIPGWAKEPNIGARTINARSETAPQKPVFRRAWRSRRCLVPASGFYEWQRQGSRKQPFLIRPAAGGLMAFAGLWERWRAPSAERVWSFTILTTEPNRRIAALHDRMPVILPREQHSRWLEATPEEAHALMAPCADELLDFHPVSTEVNSPRHNHRGLIEPIAMQTDLLSGN